MIENNLITNHNEDDSFSDEDQPTLSLEEGKNSLENSLLFLEQQDIANQNEIQLIRKLIKAVKTKITAAPRSNTLIQSSILNFFK